MDTITEKEAVSLAKRIMAYKTASQDLIRFCEVMEADPNDPNNIEKSNYDAQKFHKVLASILETVEKGEEKRIIVTFPPRHGKSELASKKFPAWLAGRKSDSFVIFTTYNQNLADDNGRDVRTTMQHPTYQKIFPNTCLKKGGASSKRLETQQGGLLVFVGREGTITGRGGDLILLDDMLKNRKEADSLLVRDRLWAWFKGTIMNRFMSDKGKMVIITTRWHEDDLVGRLTDPANPHYNPTEGKKWKIIKFTGLAEENDILGRKIGESLWPSKFGREFLLNYKALTPRDFASLYQQRPSPEEGHLFKREMFSTYAPDELPDKRYLRIYAASDHAVSTKQENDKTCLLIVGVDSEDRIWILDAFWKKIESDKAVEEMIKLMRRYKPIIWWGEPGQLSKAILPFLKKRMREEKIYVHVQEISASGDKFTKAQSFYGRMATGMVKWPRYAHWYDEAKTELLAFDSGNYDDFVDACSLIGLGLNKMLKGIAKRPIKPKVRVGSLAWVKEDSRYRQKRKRLLSQFRNM